jgi:23S rRNA (cytidine1920-2'-O)/16S rRNA (cytidine1409-2'-O)-methyltransferase
VSFISLKIVVPAVTVFMGRGARILALIKPQFEVGKDQVGKGGVVRDERLHKAVIEKLSAFFKSMGLTSKIVLPSPILGPKGNREFFVLLERRPEFN